MPIRALRGEVSRLGGGFRGDMMALGSVVVLAGCASTEPLERRLAWLESQVQTQGSRAATLESQVQTQGLRAATLESRVGSLESHARTLDCEVARARYEAAIKEIRVQPGGEEIVPTITGDIARGRRQLADLISQRRARCGS